MGERGMPIVTRRFLISLSLAALVPFAGAPRAAAQRRPPPPPPIPVFSSIKSAKCIFPVYASTMWKAGEPQVQVKMTEIVQEFTEVDAQGGTARSNAAATGADIVARLSAFSIHFLEVTSA